MLLYTAGEMRRADRITIEELGMPGIVLMENAAQGAASVLEEALGGEGPFDLAAFCGKGNNGGDGLAIARILANRGWPTTAYLFCRGEELSGDAALNLRVARACGVEIKELPGEESFLAARDQMVLHEVYVDGLLGTGLNSPVGGRLASAIELLNEQTAPVLAVDIPSGLSADTGQVLGAAVHAAWTAAMGGLKLGCLLDDGGHVGELYLVDISIPPVVEGSLGLNARLMDAEAAAALLPLRPQEGHKGTFGHLVVLGGSPGKSGAVCLAAQAGLRAGAGLVTAALPAALNPVAEAKLTACMSMSLPQNSAGFLSPEALEPVMEMAIAGSALVLGPGLSTHPGCQALVAGLVGQVGIPLVIDADGLNCLAAMEQPPLWKSGQVVLTPHPGEAARLLGTSVGEVLADRPAAARALAAKYDCVVVLKSARSLIAERDGYLWVNPSGNVLLASGGSGDVLSGLVGGLMAQGSGAAAAALTGSFILGHAADLAAEDFGTRGLAAEELIDYLPEAFISLEDGPRPETL